MLLIAREKDTKNVFYGDDFPMDLFKLIFKVAFGYIAGF
jgi:hypothetical protein